ncbi:hypothetical protein C8T65DRAFT_640205, partial [Cerioporus squamosus]
MVVESSSFESRLLLHFLSMGEEQWRQRHLRVRRYPVIPLAIIPQKRSQLTLPRSRTRHPPLYMASTFPPPYRTSTTRPSLRTLSTLTQFSVPRTIPLRTTSRTTSTSCTSSPTCSRSASILSESTSSTHGARALAWIGWNTTQPLHRDQRRSPLRRPRCCRPRGSVFPSCLLPKLPLAHNRHPAQPARSGLSPRLLLREQPRVESCSSRSRILGFLHGA